MGLINRLTTQDTLDTEIADLAAQLARGPTIALGNMKRNLNDALQSSLARVLDLEALHHSRCGMTADHREAAAAFFEKRTPVYSDARWPMRHASKDGVGEAFDLVKAIKCDVR